MKRIQTAFKFLSSLALIVLAAGCASDNLLDKENVAVGAGFKVITPRNPDQLALLRKLPADKLTPINFAAKLYYVLPDAPNNQAYVGGPKQYQLYVQLRRKQLKDSENSWLPPVSYEVVEVNAMSWDEWDGWGPVGEPGWY